MKTENFIQQNMGADKIVGRPIRLNKFKLEVKKDKKYAELLLFGDLHLGHPQSNIKKAKGMLNWALKTNTPVLLMGDLLEAGLKDSIGNSVYTQKLDPQMQMEEVIEMLQPLADKGLIKGLHTGNHEMRITKTTGIDISKVIARILKVPYLGYACWNMITVDKQKYGVYSEHGTGGSKFKHTKLKRALDQLAWIRSDALFLAHHHALEASRTTVQEISFRNKQVVEKKCYVVLTGGYIDWDNSYAQMYEMPPTEIGSPKVKFFSTEREIKISF